MKTAIKIVDDNIAARCPHCNGIVYIARNEPMVMDAEARREIAKMAVDGLSIEHLTLEQFRKEKFGHGAPCTDDRQFSLVSETHPKGG